MTSPERSHGANILWVVEHPGFVRNYAPALRLLAERGHRIRLAHQRNRGRGEDALAERLAREYPDAISVGEAPLAGAGPWPALTAILREIVDFVRYFDSRYSRASALRQRTADRVPGWFRIFSAARLLGDRGVHALLRTLLAADAAIPADPAIRAFVEAQRPDLVVVTPLVDFASQQVDYLKAARALGIPTALGVASWDNLTNKGHIRFTPDRVFVWNDAQKEEAVALHGVPPEAVVVTGAQIFDRWFETRPTQTREEFCTMVGLDPSRPFVVFLGSSSWLAPAEVYFVERWIRAVRFATDPVVATLGILVRPHPRNARRYLTLDASQMGNVAVWPTYSDDRTLAYTDRFHEDFFHSLHYAAAAVGVNTSALIEAGIVGRPVCTLRAPEFAHAQEGTLHFGHLAGERGLLRVAEGMDEHLRDLAAVVADAESGAARDRSFVESFVRPHGLDRPAAPILVEAIEACAALAAAPRAAPEAPPILLFPFALLAHWLRPDRRRAPAWLPVARPGVALWLRLVLARAWSRELQRRASRHRRKMRRWLRGVARRRLRASVRRRLRRTIRRSLDVRRRRALAHARRVPPVPADTPASRAAPDDPAP